MQLRKRQAFYSLQTKFAFGWEPSSLLSEKTWLAKCTKAFGWRAKVRIKKRRVALLAFYVPRLFIIILAPFLFPGERRLGVLLESSGINRGWNAESTLPTKAEGSG